MPMRIRPFTARTLFAFVVLLCLGFSLVIAGMAAILGTLTIAAFRIAMIGAGRKAHNAPEDAGPTSRAGADPAAQPA